MFRTFMRTALVASVCAVGFSGAAIAASVNTLNFGDGNCGTAGSVSESSSGEISRFFDSSLGQCALGATARAGGGGVGVNLGLVTTPGLGGGTAFVEVKVETLIEITLGVPDSFGGGDIPIAFTPHLSGNVSATLATGSPFARSGTAKLTAFASIAGIDSNGAGVLASGTSVALAQVFNFGGIFEDGEYLSQFSAPIGILIDPTKTIEVLFSLTARVSQAAYNDSIITANVSSFNSLSFALFGPALILPEGFTANSEFGSIVDNQYINSSSTVPLPTTLPLFGSGLAIMGFLRWRKKRTA